MVDFYIKQYSTLPELKYSIPTEILSDGIINEEVLRNVAVTFSMIDIYDGSYAIANSPGNLIVNTNKKLISQQGKYILLYKFSRFDTNDVGSFFGEFKLDFINPQLSEHHGTITLPTSIDKIKIHIIKSITKTDVELI